MSNVGQKKKANHRRAGRGGGSGRGNSQNHPTEPELSQCPAAEAPMPEGTTMVDMNPANQVYPCGHLRVEAIPFIINILTDTIKIEPDQENPEKYHVKFSYDAHACGSITLCIYELLVVVDDDSPRTRDLLKIAKPVEHGLNQIFTQEVDAGFVFSVKHDLIDASLLITTQNAIVGSKNSVSQKVIAAIEMLKGKIQVRVKSLLVFLNGEKYRIHDVNGIRKAMNQKNDHDIGCGICLSTESPGVLHSIGKLSLSTEVIGNGSNGTMVFKGKYDDRAVAVKRIPKAKGGDIDKEIQHLKAADHPHIVWLYGEEDDERYVFIALEECECNLEDLIVGELKGRISEDLLKILKSEECKVRVSDELLHLLWDLDPCCSQCKEHFSHDLLKLLAVDQNKIHFSESLLNFLRGLKPCCRQCKGHLSKDLLKIVKCNGHLSQDLLKLLWGLVAGIGYLHERGINQLNLKLKNVLIHQDTSITAKLSNFSGCETGNSSFIFSLRYDRLHF